MRRLFMVMLVGLLCATTSGVLGLVVSEQCVLDAASPADDGACAPTCLRCHCARPFDVVAPLLPVDVLLEPAEWTEPTRSVRTPRPHDVLHVPRPAAA